tara:strand:+ start:577 stop:846 length:270 start_codon:yes stop_codon:yes gene_type:complete
VYLYKKEIVMAAAKKTPAKSNDKSVYDKEFADKLIRQNYEKGILVGQQEIYKILANFLQQRMNLYFESRRDDLAKECRDILLIIKQNIK